MGVARDGGKLIKPWLIINSSRQLSPPWASPVAQANHHRRRRRHRSRLEVLIHWPRHCHNPFIHLPIHPFIHSFTQSFIHSFIHPSIIASIIHQCHFLCFFFFGCGVRQQFGLWFAASVLLRLLFHPPPSLFLWTNQGKYLPSINKYYHSSFAAHSHIQLNLLTTKNLRQNFICKFDRLICNKIFPALSLSLYLTLSLALTLSTRPGNVYFRELQNFRMSSGFFFCLFLWHVWTGSNYSDSFFVVNTVINDWASLNWL